MRKSFLLVVLMASTLGLPAAVQAANVLVYGPRGSDATAHFPGGTSYTVVDADTWANMTTEDFGAYDVIWMDDADCDGYASDFDAANDNRDVWSAAVKGRMHITGADPNAHTGNDPDNAAIWIANNVKWLGALGNTASGGRTGLYVSYGCDEEPAIDILTPFGTFVASNNGYDPDTISLPDHPLLDGINTLGALSWGSFAHQLFTGYPEGFEALTMAEGDAQSLIYEAPARVLVYGPRNGGGTFYFPAGTTYDVADADQWANMTAEDFGAYDVIYMGDDYCGDGDSSDWDAAYDNRTTWGPVVTGRIHVTGADPEWHADYGTETAATWIANNIWTLSRLGPTATGGKTGLYVSFGCDGSPVRTDVLSPFGSFSASGEDSSGDPDVILQPTYPALEGINTVDDLAWGSFAHVKFTSFPASFFVLVQSDGMNQSLIRDTDFMPATPPSVPPLKISSITPNMGPTAGGTVVTITGSGFKMGMTVKFGGIPAVTVTVSSTTMLTAVTAPHVAGTWDVILHKSGTFDVTASGAFTFVDAMDGGAATDAGAMDAGPADAGDMDGGAAEDASDDADVDGGMGGSGGSGGSTDGGAADGGMGGSGGSADGGVADGGMGGSGGSADGGVADAGGSSDGGKTDAGGGDVMADAGGADAGATDAGGTTDGGGGDAGTGKDGQVADASTDAGKKNAGGSGCGCDVNGGMGTQAVGFGPLLGLALLTLRRRRRK